MKTSSFTNYFQFKLEQNTERIKLIFYEIIDFEYVTKLLFWNTFLQKIHGIRVADRKDIFELKK